MDKDSPQAKQAPRGRAGYLVDLLLEIGPLVGDKPISWIDIRSWADHTGQSLTLWEGRVLKYLSETFLRAIRLYDGSELPSPLYVKTEEHKKRLANKVRSALREVAPDGPTGKSPRRKNRKKI